MKEVLRLVNGFYYISNLGNVYDRNKKQKKTRPEGRHKDILMCNMNGREYRVAYLVALRFLKPHPEKKYIEFKDQNPLNCEASNLKWSYQQWYSPKTIKHRRELYKKRTGKNHWKYKPFSINGKIYHTLKEAGEEMDVCFDVIRKRLINPNRPDYTYIKE